MHYFSLLDNLKRYSSYAQDDLLNFNHYSDKILSNLDNYIPFTGDLHQHEHFQLKYQAHLIRARLILLDAELQKFINMLNK